MAQEEVLIKLGVDYHSAEQDLKSFGQRFQTWTKTTLGNVSSEEGFFGLQRRELKKLANELANVSPLLGGAAKLAINPIVFALTAGIAIFAKAKEALDDWNKELDETGKRLSEASFINSIEARKKALLSSADAADRYRWEMRHLVDSEAQFMAQIAAGNVTLADRQKRMNEIRDAKYAVEHAGIDALRGAGLLTDKDADKAKAALEVRERNQKLADTARENREREAKLRGDYNAEYGKGGPLQQASENSRRIAEEAKLKQDNDAHAEADFKKQSDEQDALVKKLEDKVLAGRSWSDRWWLPPNLAGGERAKDEKDLKEARSLAVKYADILQAKKNEINADSTTEYNPDGSVRKYSTALKQTAADTADKAYREHVANLTTLKTSLDTATAKDAADEAAQRKIVAEQNKATGIRLAGEILAKDFPDIGRNLNQGESIRAYNAEQSATLKEIRGQLEYLNKQGITIKTAQ